MISMHNSVGGPRLGLQDDRLAVLCDSSIVRAIHAKLPLDVACDGNKLLAAAAVLARLFGRIESDYSAQLVKTHPEAIEGLSSLARSMSSGIHGLESHAEFYGSQVFIRQDYLVNMMQYLMQRGVSFPDTDIAYQPEFNHFGEMGIWVSPVRLTLDERTIVV